MKQYSEILITVFLLALCEFSFCQNHRVANLQKTISGDHKLFINYDIVSSDHSGSFTVKLEFTSDGESINPNPDNLYGDYGNNITPGNKIVYWDFSNETIVDIRKVEVEIKLIPEDSPQAIIEVASINNNAYAPCTVKFENLSTNADAYHWDFGDPASGSENISTAVHAEHTFSSAGIYSVTFTARHMRSKQESVFYKTVEIGAHDSPVVDFQFSHKENLKAPVSVTFINLSTKATSYIWDFGDPASKEKNTTQEKNPIHEFKKGGTYVLTLHATSHLTGKIDSIQKELVIQAADIPLAGFSYLKSSEYAPSIVNFENTSELVKSYKWDFGDELSGDMNTSGDESPVHLYEHPGNYIVTLKARPKGLKLSVVFSDTLRIKDRFEPPKAGFIIENNNSYAPGTIIFTNISANATEFSWNFGDPDSGGKNSSEEVNPTHTYIHPGEYKVILIAGNNDQNEKNVYTETVNVLRIPDQ